MEFKSVSRWNAQAKQPRHTEIGGRIDVCVTIALQPMSTADSFPTISRDFRIGAIDFDRAGSTYICNLV